MDELFDKMKKIIAEKLEVEEDKIVEYSADVKIAFIVER